jgi:hypothetical protein
MRGFIYILLNPAMKGLLKIGMTCRTTEARADELSAFTGMPFDFEVAFDVEVSNCDAAEREIHSSLASFRVNSNREFFRVGLREAIKVVSDVAARYPLSRGFPSEDADTIRRQIEMRRRNRGQSSSADSVPPPRVEEPSTTRNKIRCGRCSVVFSITLQRGESVAVCPSCLAGLRIPTGS